MHSPYFVGAWRGILKMLQRNSKKCIVSIIFVSMNCEFLHTVLLGWAGIALLTLISLFFIQAPYGKHIRSGWGMMISNRLGWVIMELVSPIALSYFFWTGTATKSDVLILIYGFWMFHYFYRSILFPLMTKTSAKKIPLSIVLMAVFFNSVNGFTNGTFFGNCADYIDESWTHQTCFWIGFILFIAGFYIHFYSDKILIQLRDEGDNKYYIPRGFLYRYISSPNYFGEILEWIGFAVMSWSPAAAVFALWTIANLLPRAFANHRWYQEKFEDYPKERKAIIPWMF